MIFVKTQKGVQEIATRGGELPPRVRRVLIMIDGKRTAENIGAMALADDLSQTLRMLEDGGYIEALSTSPEAPVADAAANGGVPVTITFRELPQELNVKELEMAQNFIINTLKTYGGPPTLNRLSIYEATRATRTHEELRAQFAPWYDAIVETGVGAKRAEELRDQLLKVI